MVSKELHFVLEAKVAPNEWVEISERYPQIEIESRYSNEDDAFLAKSKLKTALAGPWKSTYKKRPIRIGKLVAN